MKSFLLTFSIFLSVIYSLNAQYFIWGNEPITKWKEVKTSNIKLISPTSFNVDTNFISYLDSAFFYQTKLLPSKTKKLNVVLHPNTLISNGFVAWAPSRSELFTIPARNIYNGYWPQQLAWHEMRHVAQFSHAETTIKRNVLANLFGEQLTAAWVGITVPAWFLEGDATASETDFLETGRGRYPAFSLPLFASLNNNKILDYDYCMLGSYSKYAPNRYLHGYWLVAKGKQKYGANFWESVYTKNFRKNFFGTFARSFKNISYDKKRIAKFHKETMLQIRDDVKNDIEKAKIYEYEAITNSKDYSEYRILGCDSANNIVAFKKSMHGEPCFVSINKDKAETVICYTNYVFDESFGFDGNNIYYAEYKPHERWELADYSQLKQVNIYSKKINVINKKGKDLLPTASKNGKNIAKCSHNADGSYTVSIVEIDSKKILNSANFNYDEYPVSICISDESDYFYMIQQTKNDMKIVKYNFNANNSETLYSTRLNSINNLFLHDNYLYFNANINGNEEIYKISTIDNEIECLTSTAFGAYFPVLNSKSELYFCELTSNGYQIRKKSDENKVEPQNRWAFMYDLANENSEKTKKLCENFSMPKSEITDSKPYNKAKNFIHLHSWGILTLDPSTSSVNPGIQLDFQNILSTFSGSVFSGYNLNTQALESGIRWTYQGWYPIISADFTNYYPASNESFFDESVNRLTFSTYLPLKYTKNSWSFNVTPMLEITPTTFKTLSLSLNNNIYNFYIPLSEYSAMISLSSHKYTNSLNLYNKFGGFFLGAVKHLKYFNFKNLQISAISGIWLPGAFRHDGFKFRYGFEIAEKKNFRFTTLMNAPRGYNLVTNPVKNFVSGEYSCPLLYPDFHLGSLFYLKRVSATLSYDYATNINNYNFSSLGIHLATDVHFLRIYAPIQLVFSEYYLQPSKKWLFQFGIGYNLYAY